MASAPITSWKTDGETMEKVTDFIFLGSKIIADGDCSHEIKRHLFLGRKAMTKLNSILKSRDITLTTNVCIVKAMFFPVVMYGCVSWTIKKAECWRIDAFELWCWRRLLRVPRTARRSNQSILKEISPEYSLEGLMLKLKLQYFDHLIWKPTHCKRPWCWEGLKAGGEWDDRGWDGWMASATQWMWVWASSGRWWRTGKPGMLQSMGSQRVRQTEWLNNNKQKIQWFQMTLFSPQMCGLVEQFFGSPWTHSCKSRSSPNICWSWQGSSFGLCWVGDWLGAEASFSQPEA